MLIMNIKYFIIKQIDKQTNTRLKKSELFY